MSIFNVLVDIAARTASFEEGMKRVEARLEAFEEQVKKTAERTAEFFGLTVGFEALSSAIETAVGRGEELSRLSDRMGVTVESLSQLQFAAKETHIPFEALTASVNTFEKNLGMASEGLGRAKHAFQELHIDAKKLLDLPFDQQLSIIADRIAKIQNPAKQTQLVMQMFGDANMLSILRGGAEGIAKYREESDKLHYTLSAEGADALKAAEEGMLRVKASTTALSTELTIAFAPALETVAGWLVKGTQGLISFGREMNVLSDTKISELSRRLVKLQALYQSTTANLAAAEHPGLFEKILNTKGFDLGNQLETNKAAVRKNLEDIKRQMNEVNDQIIAEKKRLDEEQAKAGKTGNVTSSGDDKLHEYLVASKSRKIELDKMQEFYNKLDAMTQTDAEKQVDAYQRKQAALDELLHSGVINAQEYAKRSNEELDKILPGVSITSAKIQKDTTQTLSAIQGFADQAARNIQTSFANFLFDPFKSGIKGMLSGFIDVIRRMIAESMSANILKAMFPGAETGAGGLASMLGGFLGGGSAGPDTSAIGAQASSTVADMSAGLTFAGFAAGGRPPTNRPSLVGENGPELFMPDSAGTIIPNGGGGGNLHFAPVYNINAPNGDAQLRAALPTLLAEAASKAKRDVLDAFQRQGFGGPRNA